MSNIIHTNGEVQLDTPYETDKQLQDCGLTDWRIATDDEVTTWKTANADKIKKQLIQSAKATRDTAINEITNAKLLDELQLDAGIITQTIYDARKTARLAQLATVQTAFYTTTGLTQPTTITA